jgi:hypothetical protein
MSALALKALATALTLGTAVASALYVAAHVKNPTAPLHPSVVSRAAAGARLHLGPSVQSGDVEPVTSTYAS